VLANTADWLAKVRRLAGGLLSVTLRVTFMKDRKKCAHPACDCLAEEGSKYCSQYCKDAGDTMELSCNCGHQGCALETAVGYSPVAE